MTFESSDIFTSNTDFLFNIPSSSPNSSRTTLSFNGFNDHISFELMWYSRIKSRWKGNEGTFWGIRIGNDNIVLLMFCTTIGNLYTKRAISDTSSLV